MKTVPQLDLSVWCVFLDPLVTFNVDSMDAFLDPLVTFNVDSMDAFLDPLVTFNVDSMDAFVNPLVTFNFDAFRFIFIVICYLLPCSFLDPLVTFNFDSINAFLDPLVTFNFDSMDAFLDPLVTFNFQRMQEMLRTSVSRGSPHRGGLVASNKATDGASKSETVWVHAHAHPMNCAYMHTYIHTCMH